MLAETAQSYEIVTEARECVAEIQFALGEIMETITLKVFWEPSLNCYSFQHSHLIHTPTQAGPYRTSRPFADTKEQAIEEAMRGFREFYSGAVEAGHTPSSGWLVLDEDFR